MTPAQDHELIQQAAAEAGLSISDYVRSRTVEDARRDLADRRRVRISPDHAEMFYAALDDATPVPELQQLANAAGWLVWIRSAPRSSPDSPATGGTSAAG